MCAVPAVPGTEALPFAMLSVLAARSQSRDSSARRATTELEVEVLNVVEEST